MFAGKDDDWAYDNDDIDETLGGADASPAKQFTAEEMEFFEEFDFDRFNEDDEEEDDAWAEEEERRQQVRDELDQRKGRGWSDPWEITDEDWMQKRVFDDLVDWTPALCSRISMERVKVHPGKKCIDVLKWMSISL
jgi:hypothetical protein